MQAVFQTSKNIKKLDILGVFSSFRRINSYQLRRLTDRKGLAWLRYQVPIRNVPKMDMAMLKFSCSYEVFY